MFRKTRGPAGPRPVITPFEFAAVAYLALPVALFFLAYGKPSAGLAAAAFIALSLWRCAKLVDLKAAFPSGWVDAFFVACAATIVYVSGSFGGGIFPNSDWVKHFAVFRFLIDNDTLTGLAPGYDGMSMRYYLGWYVVPALLTKITSSAALLPIVGVWTTIGIYLFFRMVAQLSDTPKWRYALPLIIVAFSGADAIGSSLTGFSIGPDWHMEWWAGWVQYSSMITDIFWAPQHALSAWLGIALALRLKDSPASLTVFPLATTAILLWSPFSALGVAPFYLWAMAKSIRSIRIMDAMTAVLMLLVTIIICRYLRAGGGSTEMVFLTVFQLPCLNPGPCYTVPHYLGFLALEVLGFIVALHIATRGRNAPLWIATMLLLTMPFVKFGGSNDLNLHATIPALTLLAIGAWQALHRAPQAMTFALACLLTAGAATPLGEIRRSFTMTAGPTPDMTMDYLITDLPSLRAQYLITKSPWMIRRPISLAPNSTSEQSYK